MKRVFEVPGLSVLGIGARILDFEGDQARLLEALCAVQW